MNSIDKSFEHFMRKALSERIETISQIIATGSCKTLDSYREAVGEIRGLKTALQDCDDIKNKLNEG